MEIFTWENLRYALRECQICGEDTMKEPAYVLFGGKEELFGKDGVEPNSYVGVCIRCNDILYSARGSRNPAALLRQVANAWDAENAKDCCRRGISPLNA